MIKFVSTRGKAKAVDFEQAVLNGFAEDRGFYVPDTIPSVSGEQMQSWSELSFNDLAFEILSLYIDRSLIPADDLKQLIAQSTAPFTHPDIVPVVPLKGEKDQYLLELFHGPTLSFKDIAMGFLVNCMDYFLKRRKDTVSIVMCTTGDTGPAAAYASRGKKSINCWVLYPREFLSEEQTRQMSTLNEPNIHAVAVENCAGGGDDIDDVIAELFADRDLVQKFRLSSVNSVNWCRVMYQSIHYFYSYFRVVDKVGEPITFSVPAGAFGNLFAGFLAREMGLPVAKFICANNRNGTIHRLHETGRFGREPIKMTPSNAIDITLPYNYWRFLYFVSGKNGKAVDGWMNQIQEQGYVEFDDTMMQAIRKGYVTTAISDEATLATIDRIYQQTGGYLLDPHGAVAVTAAKDFASRTPERTKIISILTAHPSKFSDVTLKALTGVEEMPEAGKHESIEAVKNHFETVKLIDCNRLKTALIHGMEQT